jgi:curved DNA-binding protein
MKDPYVILGVTRNSNPEQIKSAYRNLAVRFHPDKNHGSKEAEEKFKEINQAYDILKDPDKKAGYDNPARSFKYNSNSNFDFNGMPGFNFTSTRTNNHGNDRETYEEILRDLMNQRNRDFQFKQSKNRDINISLHVTLQDIFNNVEKEVIYSTEGSSHRKIKVKIPENMSSGMKIRYPGLGEAIAGAPAGDLYVTLHLLPNETFSLMDSSNLLVKTTINYLEALVGCNKDIPTIEGGTITLHIPANVAPNQRLRTKGKGMKTGNQRSDMIVEIQIIPIQLTSKEQSQIQEILKNHKDRI